MSSVSDESTRPEPVSGVRVVMDAWAASLGDVLQSMTDQHPAVDWQPGSGPVAAGGSADSLLWWEQSFGPVAASPRSGEQYAGTKLWVGAPRVAWEFAGTLTLKAAGLEEVAEVDVRNTWCEILSQALSGTTRAIGAALGEEVGCKSGAERPPDPPPPEWAAVTLRFGDAEPLPLAVALDQELLRALEPAPGREAATQAVERAAAAPPQTPNVELLLDVDLPVSISFGRAQMALNDVLKLSTGSIVELSSGIHDQVEVLVNHCLVARGEVVVVDGNYGVRILEIASRRDRLRGVR